VKILRLTPKAKAALKDIVKYTLQNFGEEQAKHYHQQLIDKGRLLCASQFPIGRNCSVLLDAAFINSSKLFYVREGMHYLVYTESSEFIVIHNFIHVGRDLPGLIQIIEKNI
jgi:plasmid stabilization system protein ParE